MTPKAYGYYLGIGVSAGLLFLLLQQNLEDWHSAGPLNPGHEDLICKECHIPADGTIRQQIQANVRFYLGQRHSENDFVFTKISNKQCIACHDKKGDDHHPTYRFNEPKFKKVRVLIHPELCISCHLEHSGKRVSHFKATDCKLCHKDLRIEDDAITVPHDELIKREDWETCMGCHDFHGNHKMDIEKIVGRSIKAAKIQDYFKTAPSPYLGGIIHKAKESIYEK